MSDSPKPHRQNHPAIPNAKPAESVVYNTVEFDRLQSGSEFDFDLPAKPGEVGKLGPYRIVRELGRGGMGAVFEAYDERLGRSVALKVMLPKYAAIAESRGRFLREARAAAKLANDHIVTIYEANIYNDTPCIAMQLLQGLSLDQFLKANPKLSLPQVLQIGKEIAMGLAAAHDAGLVHRDIKLANIWMESPNYRVKILDFGLAKQASREMQTSGEIALDVASLDHTATGTILGTPLYMSPEQARGEPVDYRTDLYSLGVLLYRISTGVMPFGGNSMRDLLISINNYPAKPARELNPELPVSFSNLIDRLLRKRAEQRPGSARRIALELQHIGQETASPWEAIAPSDEHLSIAICAYSSGHNFLEIEDILWEQGIYREMIPIIIRKLIINRAEFHLRMGKKPEQVIVELIAKGLEQQDAKAVVGNLNLSDSVLLWYARRVLFWTIIGISIVITLSLFDFIDIPNNMLFLLTLAPIVLLYIYIGLFASRPS